MTSCNAGWALSAPVLLTLAVCLGVAFLSAWVSRQRHFPGQRSFFMLHLGTLWWMFAAALEMAAQGPQCKMLWASMALVIAAITGAPPHTVCTVLMGLGLERHNMGLSITQR